MALPNAVMPQMQKLNLKKILNVYKENTSAAYGLDIKIEKPAPMYDRDTKNKSEELGRLYAAKNEKLAIASNTVNLQILTLVPDSCSKNYCSQYFGVSEYLVRPTRELEHTKWILWQSFQKKGKSEAQETNDFDCAFFEDDEYRRQLSRKKDYVSTQKGVHKQKQ